MYKIASDKRQTVLHRGRPNNWVNGQEQLSPEEGLRLLKNGLHVLEDRIKKAMPWEKRKLGREKIKLQNEIVAFRAANGLLRPRHNTDDLHHLFIEVAREMLSKVQFEILWNATLREYSKGTNRLTETQRAALRTEAAER